MSYINQVFKEVDEAGIGLVEYSSRPENQTNFILTTLILNQIEAVKRLKLMLSSVIGERPSVPHLKISEIL